MTFQTCEPARTRSACSLQSCHGGSPACTHVAHVGRSAAVAAFPPAGREFLYGERPECSATTRVTQPCVVVKRVSAERRWAVLGGLWVSGSRAGAARGHSLWPTRCRPSGQLTVQAVPNPVPRVPHPDWLLKRLSAASDAKKQRRISSMFAARPAKRIGGSGGGGDADMEDLGTVKHVAATARKHAKKRRVAPQGLVRLCRCVASASPGLFWSSRGAPSWTHVSQQGPQGTGSTRPCLRALLRASLPYPRLPAHPLATHLKP